MMRMARNCWLSGIAVLIAGVMAWPGNAEEHVDFLQGVPKPKPVSPASTETIDGSVTRGVDFLVKKQNKNGSWGSATRTKSLNIYAPVPGGHDAFRAATTSLCVSALIQSRDDRPAVKDAIERGEVWLISQLGRVRRANQDAIYNVWAHAFGIEAMVDLMAYGPENPKRNEELAAVIRQQVDLLDRYESVDGGWGYYDFRYHGKQPTSSPTSFTTATGLIALIRAEDVGVTVPKPLIKRAADCIRAQQKPDFSYFYSYRGPTKGQPMRSINRPGGSLGRSQACNLALRMSGDGRITDEVCNVWLDRLIARNGWLDIGRKRPIPHESHFLVAGYFYYYGHWYAARTFPILPDADRPRHQAQMSRLIVDLQETDGSWWDYALYDYHQSYGTAMAIMTLKYCLADADSAATAAK